MADDAMTRSTPMSAHHSAAPSAVTKPPLSAAITKSTSTPANFARALAARSWASMKLAKALDSAVIAVMVGVVMEPSICRLISGSVLGYIDLARDDEPVKVERGKLEFPVPLVSRTDTANLPAPY